MLTDEGENAGFAQRATFITDPDGVLRWKVRQSADWRLAFLLATLHNDGAGSLVGGMSDSQLTGEWVSAWLLCFPTLHSVWAVLAETPSGGW